MLSEMAPSVIKAREAQKLKEMWARIDADGSGALDAEELEGVMALMGYDKGGWWPRCFQLFGGGSVLGAFRVSSLHRHCVCLFDARAWTGDVDPPVGHEHARVHVSPLRSEAAVACRWQGRWTWRR
eukprot:COSAG01_NODE_1404_length_10443_cov_29.217517_17_plen_126_part_00